MEPWLAAMWWLLLCVYWRMSRVKSGEIFSLNARAAPTGVVASSHGYSTISAHTIPSLLQVCKNLVLAGVQSMVLVDDGIVEPADLAAQFYLSPADVGVRSVSSHYL